MNTSEEYLQRNWLDDYIEFLPRYKEIVEEKKRLAEKLDLPSVEKFKAPLAALNKTPQGTLDFSGKSLHFLAPPGQGNDPEKLQAALESLIPWRKGPFQYQDTLIDTEWKSNRKWDRIAPYIPDLKYKRICDIGCNNGYYMYRLLSLGDPELIWGLDPMIRYYFYFKLNRLYFDSPKIQYDILGVDHLDLMPNFFDLVLFMGVIYHRRNPIECLQKLAISIKPGGTLIMESSGIPGEDPLCLIPEERYLKAPGYWFLPTASA
nr:tRNA 5-methoxyuridine(34)/uridine 5-oxyacetic acid(34) synthase CmoB [Spirochaetaceae bacterium]